MKKLIKSENLEDSGCLYTRIQYSDGSYYWYNGFDNNGRSSLDAIPYEENDDDDSEYSFGSSRELEDKYQKDIKTIREN